MLLARKLKPIIALVLARGGVAAGHDYLRQSGQKQQDRVLVDVTEEEKWDAIDDGVDWLAGQQDGAGSWTDSSYTSETVGSTGLALIKLVEYAREQLPPLDPFGGANDQGEVYAHAGKVIDGFDWLFKQARPFCDGLIFDLTAGAHQTYFTGIAMMAIAATGTPDKVVVSTNMNVDGKTFKEVLEENRDYFVCAQNPDDGGWRYTTEWDWIDSDNSNTGFAVLGLAYAEAPPFNVDIPNDVKNDLSGYIDYIQNDVSGGSGYSSPTSWVNSLKTGNLLFEAAFVGDDINTQRVKDAIEYIESKWSVTTPSPPSSVAEGWYNHNQAMYCLMKGFEYMGVEEDGIPGVDDWFQDFVNDLVGRQNADGSWPGASEPWGGDLIATEFALLTLERLAPIDTIPPYITIVECPEGEIDSECMEPISCDDMTCNAEDLVDGDVSDTCTCDGTVDEEMPGDYTLTFTAEDSAGNIGVEECIVNVVDTTPPSINIPGGIRKRLWPPNHKMVTVASGVHAYDSCIGTAESLGMTMSVDSNEAINGPGDGNTRPDWRVVDNGDGTSTLQLRSERSGRGTGREYYVTMDVYDDSSNLLVSEVEVVRVPHNRKG